MIKGKKKDDFEKQIGMLHMPFVGQNTQQKDIILFTKISAKRL